jgi:hypothetical protein
VASKGEKEKGIPQANCTNFLFGLAQGLFTVPGWEGTKVFVSFDRGRTWKNVHFPLIPASRGFPGEAANHADLLTGADPMVTATADGTFYIAWDAEHITSSTTSTDGGIAVSKSTDGGRTWSTPVLTATTVDRPSMTAAAACQFFVAAPAPCTVFETTRDAGLDWTRHTVPVPSDSTGSVLAAADPAAPGTYTLAVLDSP